MVLPGLTLVLPWSYLGLTLVSPWSYPGLTLVLPWSYLVLPWSYLGLTLVLLGRGRSHPRLLAHRLSLWSRTRPPPASAHARGKGSERAEASLRWCGAVRAGLRCAMCGPCGWWLGLAHPTGLRGSFISWGGGFDLICNAQRRVSTRPLMRPLHPGTKNAPAA